MTLPYRTPAEQARVIGERGEFDAEALTRAITEDRIATVEELIRRWGEGDLLMEIDACNMIEELKAKVDK